MIIYYVHTNIIIYFLILKQKLQINCNSLVCFVRYDMTERSTVICTKKNLRNDSLNYELKKVSPLEI